MRVSELHRINTMKSTLLLIYAGLFTLPAPVTAVMRHGIPYDGWGNNVIHPEYGAAYTPTGLHRTASFVIYPHAAVSNKANDDINALADKLYSTNQVLDPFGRNVLLSMFGKLVAQDMVDTSGVACPMQAMALGRQYTTASAIMNEEIVNTVSGMSKNEDAGGPAVFAATTCEKIWWQNCSYPNPIPANRTWQWQKDPTITKRIKTLGTQVNNMEAAELVMQVPLQQALMRTAYVADDADSSDSMDQTGLRRPQTTASSFLDAGFLYGPNEAWTMSIRTFEGGRVKLTEEGLVTRNSAEGLRLPLHNPLNAHDNMQPRVANPKILVTPHTLALQTVWMRFHNYVARQVADSHPMWSDEAVFIRTRLHVIAAYQHIVATEYLPAIGVNLPEYAGYQQGVNAGLSDAFVAAFRAWGHSQTPPVWLQLSDVTTSPLLNDITQRTCVALAVAKAQAGSGARAKRHGNITRTCETTLPASSTANRGSGYADSAAKALYITSDADLDAVLRGFMVQQHHFAGLNMVTDARRFMNPSAALHGRTFSAPVKEQSSARDGNGAGSPNNSVIELEQYSNFVRSDLAALDIAGGRDMGVGKYNEVRSRYGLPRMQSWNDIANNSIIANRLRQAYGDNIDDLDFLVGGLAEDGGLASPLPPSFRAVFESHFANVRDGDRFWYLNSRNVTNPIYEWTADDIEWTMTWSFKTVLRVTTGLSRELDVMYGPTRDNIFVAPTAFWCNETEISAALLYMPSCSERYLAALSDDNVASCSLTYGSSLGRRVCQISRDKHFVTSLAIAVLIAAAVSALLALALCRCAKPPASAVATDGLASSHSNSFFRRWLGRKSGSGKSHLRAMQTITTPTVISPSTHHIFFPPNGSGPSGPVNMETQAHNAAARSWDELRKASHVKMGDLDCGYQFSRGLLTIMQWNDDEEVIAVTPCTVVFGNMRCLSEPSGKRAVCVLTSKSIYCVDRANVHVLIHGLSIKRVDAVKHLGNHSIVLDYLDTRNIVHEVTFKPMSNDDPVADAENAACFVEFSRHLHRVLPEPLFVNTGEYESKSGEIVVPSNETSESGALEIALNTYVAGWCERAPELTSASVAAAIKALCSNGHLRYSDSLGYHFHFENLLFELASQYAFAQDELSSFKLRHYLHLVKTYFPNWLAGQALPAGILSQVGGAECQCHLEASQVSSVPLDEAIAIYAIFIGGLSNESFIRLALGICTDQHTQESKSLQEHLQALLTFIALQQNLEANEADIANMVNAMLQSPAARGGQADTDILVRLLGGWAFSIRAGEPIAPTPINNATSATISAHKKMPSQAEHSAAADPAIRRRGPARNHQPMPRGSAELLTSPVTAWLDARSHFSPPVRKLTATNVTAELPDRDDTQLEPAPAPRRSMMHRLSQSILESYAPEQIVTAPMNFYHVTHVGVDAEGSLLSILRNAVLPIKRADTCGRSDTATAVNDLPKQPRLSLPEVPSPSALGQPNSRCARLSARLMIWKEWVSANSLFLAWTAALIAGGLAIVITEAVQATPRRAMLSEFFGPGFLTARITAQLSLYAALIVMVTRLEKSWTFLRDHFPTALAIRLPIDHLYIYHQAAGFAFSACGFIHTGAHLFNFYIAAKLPASSTNCLLGTQYADGEVPSTLKLLFTTIPGITGVLLLVAIILITPFSFEGVRRASFAVFYLIHRVYMLILPAIIMHGALGMFAAPNGWKYIAVPAILFLLEKFATQTAEAANTVEIVSSEALPGKAIRITARRPPGWNFRSGQYVHVTCPAISKASAHPFTVASAPQEPLLQFTIKAVGPWTQKLREICASQDIRRTKVEDSPIVHQSNSGGLDGESAEELWANRGDIAPSGFPWITIDGPHGAPSQQWERYNCVLLVAGGIGVTPMLSVLLDVMHRVRAQAAGFHSELRTQHIELAWVAKTLAEASWLKETVLRLEQEDKSFSIAKVSLFVTQQSSWHNGVVISQPEGTVVGPLAVEDIPDSQAADKVWNAELLGFNQTSVYMGRPNFKELLHRLQQEHPGEQTIGVFACGPQALMKSLAQSVREVNARHLGPSLHAFEEHF